MRKNNGKSIGKRAIEAAASIKATFRKIVAKRQVQRGLLVYAAIFPFVLFFALETINPVTTTATLFHSLHGLGIILLSALLIACTAAVLYALIGRFVWSYAIVSAILGVAYVVNHFKLMIAGQVFVPTDLMIAGEALMVTDLGAITIERVLLLRIALVILLHVPLAFIKLRIRFKRRVAALPVALALFLGISGINATASGILNALDVDTSGSLTAMYRDTGLIVGFHAALVDHNQRSITAGVAAERVSDFFPPPSSGAGYATNPAAGVRPNVIVIMSEAFIDPTIIDNLYFSTDPAANFRRLAAQYISGDVVVPVFGGGTANTELEFLTGSAMFFMGSAYYVPYNNVGRYFFRDITTAMPWLFRANGYRSIAVHPYTRYFFSRNLVYPRLGFNEFIGYEDMYDPQYKGFFVSDEFFTDQIIEQILLAEQAGEPLFLFGISMQNHWEYWGSKYYSWPEDVTVYSPLLNDYELAVVRSFAQGIYDADKQLGRLVDFVESRNTPTIIVFFGDHLPILGEHNDAILEGLGFISDQRIWHWNERDRQRMFSVPYLVWSNFADTSQHWGTLSTYFLAANVLELSGIDLNRYWHYTLYLNRHFGGLTENHFVSRYGSFHNLYRVHQRPYVAAMEALHQVKWFGTDELFDSLSEIILRE